MARGTIGALVTVRGCLWNNGNHLGVPPELQKEPGASSKRRKWSGGALGAMEVGRGCLRRDGSGPLASGRAGSGLEACGITGSVMGVPSECQKWSGEVLECRKWPGYASGAVDV